jgi:hypothetical protein
MGGLVLGGAVATPSFAATKTDKITKTIKAVKPAKAATKTVVYRGYEFQVPASWPVYRLDQHPDTCVRYDVHAVYLGTPGPNMKCTAGVVGRTQTISFIPGAATETAQRPAQEREEGSNDLQRVAAVNGTIRQNATTQELSIALGTAATSPTVLGTYGTGTGADTDSATVKQVLDSLHQAPAGAPQTAQTKTAPAQPGGGGAGQGTDRSELNAAPPTEPAANTGSAKTSSTSTSWQGVPSHRPAQNAQPVTTPKPASPKAAPAKKSARKPASRPVVAWKPVSGFDACTAPPLATMSVYRSDYAAIGIYLGGPNAACSQPNLSTGWVKAVRAGHWGLLPTYVGPQAPCWAGTGSKIVPSRAAAQGAADGVIAVEYARSVGLGKGTPIYDDMEAFAGAGSCTTAVLDYLGAWDRRVAADGYLTGVYSSLDSGVDDIEIAAAARTAGFTAPDAVWVALWDNKATLNAGLRWVPSDRSKQYSGNMNATVGGITLNIDKDIVGGPMAR